MPRPPAQVVPLPSSDDAPASAREVLRRVGIFSMFPLVIGCVQVLMDCFDGLRCAHPGWIAVNLLLAVLAFFLLLAIPALYMLKRHGQSHALRLHQHCPACGSRQVIINTACIVCEAEMGVQRGSWVTYALCMQAFMVFEAVLYFKPLRFLV
jgi:hypothetical protein